MSRCIQGHIVRHSCAEATGARAWQKVDACLRSRIKKEVVRKMMAGAKCSNISFFATSKACCDSLICVGTKGPCLLLGEDRA